MTEYAISVPNETRNVQVYWPEHANKLAICLSGGLDSAILFWLWANNPIPVGCELIAVTIKRYPECEGFARNILREIESRTGKKFQHLLLDVHTSKHKVVSSPIKTAFFSGKFDFVMSADTKNTNQIGSVNGHHPASRRSEETGNDPNRKWHLPFIHLDKRFTVKLMHDLNLKWLEEITNSCTNSPTQRCNNCWWCHERSWAYNELDLIDYGKF